MAIDSNKKTVKPPTKPAPAAPPAPPAPPRPRRALLKLEIHRLDGTIDEQIFNLPVMEEGETLNFRVCPSHG